MGATAEFVLVGGVSSTAPDIIVKKNGIELFNIEVKKTPSQGGQFVVSYNGDSFSYSKKNKTPENRYSKAIVEKLNLAVRDSLETDFRGTISIENVEDFAAKWLIKLYKSKSIKYIICNNFTLVPVQQLDKYFTIKTECQIRRSGTADAGEITQPLLRILSERYPYTDYIHEGKRLYIKPIDGSRPKEHIFFDGREYSLVRVSEDYYELRKESNTFAYTISFQMSLKKGKRGVNMQSLDKAISNCVSN